ncbi:hypothetical protein Rs2_13257 [Raphanus sativus]|nr:hypothetical protein Rs2_13255 [Raphanus sativus]KAJ4899306.1 hypothetical protein Rs2_13257 [Raphanus sativus]
MDECEIQSSEIDGNNDGPDPGALQPPESDKPLSPTHVSSALLVMNCDEEEQPKEVVQSPQTLVRVQTPVSSAPPVLESGDTVVLTDAQTSTHALNDSLQGAWAKPLIINGNTNLVSSFENNMDNSQWPALSTKRVAQKEDQTVVARLKAKKNANQLDATHTHQTRIPTDKTRFPWAARMNQQTRNLHRVTVPEYMEDGTPKVIIPDHVLLQGLQNHKEYVIGQFHRCLVPSGGLVYAVLNRLWGRKCEISVRKLGEFSYIFHIPDEATRKWILQRSLWHVDDCIMVVAPWTAKDSITLPEINSIPLWVKLKNIPITLFSIFGVEWIASGLGEPMLSHKPWLDPTMLGEAKVMVEVELDKPFPQKVAAWDKQGNFAMIDVEYSWLPTTCERCGQLGHKQKRCLSIPKANTSATGNNSASVANVFATSVDAATHDKETQQVPTDDPSSLQGHGHVRVPLQEEITTSSHYEKQSNGSHIGLTKPASNKDDLSQIPDQVTCDLASLAAVSALENMYVPPTVVYVNEATDPPAAESAPSPKMVYVNETIVSPAMETAPSSTNQISTKVLEESSRIHEIDLGSNKFASLVFYDGEDEVQLEPDDPIDLLTPSGKRILRERPVKLSEKAKEWQLSTARGRGNRGRGNRGRHM